MLEKKDTYTNEQLAKKIVANSCYPYEEPIKNPDSNIDFRRVKNLKIWFYI